LSIFIPIQPPFIYYKVHCKVHFSAVNDDIIYEKGDATLADKRRDKGEGSIYFRDSDKRWVAKIKPANSSKSKVFYGKTEQEVKKKLKEFKVQLAKNDYVVVQKGTLQEYMDRWLNNVRANDLKPKSFDRLEATLNNQVYKHIGDIQIAGITPNDVQVMINELKEDSYSYSTIKKVYDAINACFKLGILKGEVAKNPCVGVVLPKNKKRQVSDIRFFDDAEMELICVECVDKYGNGKQIYRLGHSIILLLNTGIRMCELLALKWSDISFEKRTMRIDESMVLIKNRDEDTPTKWVLHHQDSTKTSSSNRTVPLNQKAISALEELYKITGQYEYVMSTGKVTVMSPRNLDRMFRNILTRCSIKPCGVHACRHSFASLMLRKKLDIKVISEILGHSSVQITYDIYTHIIDSIKHESVNLLDV